MVIAKEADLGSPQLTEVLQVERNGFARFLQENNEVFHRHAFLTYELRDEEEAWKNSPEVEQLIKDNIDFVKSSTPTAMSAKTLRRKLEIARETLLANIFGTQEEKQALSAKAMLLRVPLLNKIDSKKMPLVVDFHSRMEEMEKGFHEARTPIATELNTARKELFSKFKEFVLSDFSSLFALQDFLSNKNYSSKREAIRPFFAALVQSEDRLTKEHEEGIIGLSSKKWINEMRETSTPELINEFTLLKKSPTVLDWVQFVSEDSSVNPQLKLDDILRRNPNPSSWPLELKNAFILLIQSKYLTAVTDIGKSLEQFRKHTAVKGLMRQELSEPKKPKSKVVITADNKGAEDEDREKEVPSQNMHPVGVLSQEIGRSHNIRHTTEEDLEIFLAKESKALDPSDPRMLEDLRRIVENLRKNPRGPGTKNLIVRTVGIGNSRISLRSMNPGKKIGLSLSHPESAKVRVVYVIHRDREESVIGIEGIYNHQDYDSKFGS